MPRGQSGAGGLGKGVPLFFRCAQDRRMGPGERAKHRVTRTGRTRAHKAKGAQHPRMMAVAHEYRCTCGHEGWSAHRGILAEPLEQTEKGTAR